MIHRTYPAGSDLPTYELRACKMDATGAAVLWADDFADAEFFGVYRIALDEPRTCTWVADFDAFADAQAFAESRANG